MTRWLPILLLGSACTSDPATEPQVCEGAFDPYIPGMTVESSNGTFTIELVSADPDPPDEGDNSWVLRVTDANGPVGGASVSVEPWMPAHGHGINPSTYLGAPGADGVYTLDPFNLIMPGVWEFNILVSEGMDAETAVFTFCAEG